MWTFEEIHNGALKGCQLADRPGVYKVFPPRDFELVFRNDPDATGDSDSIKPVALLTKRWNLIQSSPREDDKDILYIGTTTGTLRKRVECFAKYGYGEVKNHRGGYPIWQIKNNKHLLVEIYPCENPKKKETELLDSYIDYYGTEPVGNTAVGKGSRYRYSRKEDVYNLRR